MDRIKGNGNTPTCLLSHTFLNKLSVIIGSCDIALEQMKIDNTTETQAQRRVIVVRQMAWELVAEVREHGCELDRTSRIVLMELSQTQRPVQGHAGLVGAVDAKGNPLEVQRESDQRLVGRSRISKARAAKSIRH